MVKYSTISIPKELHEEIKRSVIENPRYGYSSVAEFSIEAIKIRLEEIRRALEEEKGEKQKKLKMIVNKLKAMLH